MSQKQTSAQVSREKILAIALQEFGSAGYQNTSTNTVCKRADISKGLLFHYYPSKANLFYAVAQECIGQLQQALSPFGAAAQQTDDTFLLAYYRCRMQFFLEHPYHKRVLTELLSLSSSCPAEQQLVQLGRAMCRQRRHMFEQLLGQMPLRKGISLVQLIDLLEIYSEHLQQK